MNYSRINIIKKLINTINLNYINKDIIARNSEKLYDIYKVIKPYWNTTNTTHSILNKDTEHYKKIFKITATSLLGDYGYIKKELKKTINIIHLNDSNIDFYYLNFGKYDKDINLINNLFMQTISLAKYSKLYNKTNILVVWIPVNRNRDYNFNNITTKNLKQSIDNFNAFTASGVTFGVNPRTTIISRYEEISKLLLHELIHNYNLDGPGYHNHNNELINTYTQIKNPKTSIVKNYDYMYSIYESYTELLSSYLSMIYRNINLTEKNELIKRYQTETMMEILYSYNTIANLIKLNEYASYEEFKKNKSFKGDICVYEYYYLKGLMYNNYELELCNNKTDFLKNYDKIININKDDPLLEEIYKYMVVHQNFKYNFYD